MWAQARLWAGRRSYRSNGGVDMEHFTVEQIAAMVAAEHHAQVNRWLARGDGVAVYRNVAGDSRDFGHRQFASYGSPAAQLETEIPPERLPDIGSQVNWRYALEGTYRGEPIPAGRKSLAFALRYRAADRTLSDDEVIAAHGRVEEAVRSRFRGEIRGR